MRRCIRFVTPAVLLWLALPAVLGSQRARPSLMGLPTSAAFFDDSVVHDVRLAMSDRDWQALKDHYLENTYYPADFYWRNHILRNVGVRSRGTGSRSPVKPHLKVAFDRYVSGQQFLGLSSVVLRNNTQDPSNMHERLSMLLFARLGLPSSREAYMRFFVNGEYMGLYTIVEAIDDRFLARNFPESDGYLFSFDYPPSAQPFFFEDRGSDPAKYVPQPFKPENHESNPRSDVIVQMVEAVNQSSDAAYRQAVQEYLDLPAVIRHVAVETFLGDDDGVLGDWGMNNTYLYRLAGGRQFSFIVWDKSDAFMDGPNGSIWHNLNDVAPAQRNRLMVRGLQEPDLMTLYLDTLLDCARSAAELPPGSMNGPGWLDREITRQYSQIHASALADTKKPFTNEQFEQSVADLRVFAAQRGTVVARQVAQARPLVR